MATQLQLRRGTTAENNLFTGAQGELTMDTDTNALRVHDGSTAGGFKVDTVVAFQEPTAQNDYTWYRKYASGWVEQGGEAAQGTVNLPVEMSNAHYTVITQPMGSGANPGSHVQNRTTTSFIVGNASGWSACWEVKGIAA